jgi:hypothetical protein
VERYTVKLEPPAAHVIPPLLEQFGKWLGKQAYGSVGTFELIAEPVPEQWCKERAPRFSADAFSFLRFADGSRLLLIQTLRQYPPAVGYLGAEGDSTTVGSTLEEFLLLLARGKTGLRELDSENASGRKKLRAWLTKKGIARAPEVPHFDFASYLEGTPYDVSDKPSLPPPEG